MNRTTFIELLEKRDFKTLKNTLEIMNAVDIALLLSNLEDKERAFAFRLIPKDKAADVFSNMSNPIQSYLVKIFTEKELRELLDNLYMDDTVDLLEELPANLVTRILHTVSSDKRDLINQLLKFPENSAGSIMTTEYVDYDNQRDYETYQRSRNPQRDHLYVLCVGKPSFDWNCLCQRPDDFRRQYIYSGYYGD